MASAALTRVLLCLPVPEEDPQRRGTRDDDAMTTRRWVLLGIALMVVAGLVAFAVHSPYVDLALLVLTDLNEFSLEAYERLLVIAPHCDDETIAAGGLMMAAQRQGIDVRVVIATGGEGYLQATIRYLRQPFPSDADFIRMGYIRQQESLAALRSLGITPDKVIFLGYPERGLPDLLMRYWDTDEPYRSPYTRTVRSPFPLCHNPDAVYAGSDLLSDLTSILSSYRPDLIVYPHPNDEHRDHWALSAFVRMALLQLQLEDATYRPDALAYLVHYNDGHPYWRGLHMEAPLIPPARLAEVSEGWVYFPLRREDVEAKLEAIHVYRSQLITVRNLLESFARSNELFQRVHLGLYPPTMADGEPFKTDTWRTADDEPIEPIVRDPVRDNSLRRRLPSGDILGLYVALDGDGALMTCGRTRDRVIPILRYVLRFIAIGPDGAMQQSTWYSRTSVDSAYTAPDAFCERIPLDKLEGADLLAIGAQVWLPASEMLDRTVEVILPLGDAAEMLRPVLASAPEPSP